jgi:hypothetical protein
MTANRAFSSDLARTWIVYGERIRDESAVWRPLSDSKLGREDAFLNCRFHFAD